MKDIDFDELDKAVSSVLGTKAEKKTEEVPTPVSETKTNVEPESSNAPASDLSLEHEVISQLDEKTDTNEPADNSRDADKETSEPSSSLSLESEVMGTVSSSPEPKHVVTDDAESEDVSSVSAEPERTEPENEISQPAESYDEAETESETLNDSKTEVAEQAEHNEAVRDGGEVTESKEKLEQETEHVEAENEKPELEDFVSPVATRRGKFMDVVHPSSDMNPEAAVPASPAYATPHITVEHHDDEPREEVYEEYGEEAEYSETHEPSEEAKHETTAEPANYDESADDYAQTPVDDTERELDQLVAAPPVEDHDEPAFIDEQDTAQNPFIPGVEVDKRPLGQPVSEEHVVHEAEEEITVETEDPVLEQGAMPVGEPLPREFEPEVVKTENIHVVEEQPVATAASVAATGSVASQAVEASSQQPAATNALYDTTTYNQPLTDDAGNKPGMAMWLWWVIGLVACLLVGGGVGAAFFFFGL